MVIVRLLIGCALIWLPILDTGCGTIAPKVEDTTSASFDGNVQNSGIISMDENGAIISSSARERYNAYIVLCGAETIPPTKVDFGITDLKDGTCRLTMEGLQRWYDMKLIHDRDALHDSGTLWNKIK